jgi:hypothetical protein
MKIKDIITEDEKGRGPISQRFQQATVGLDKFRDHDLADRFYELNRVMMACAGADGKNPIDVDPESWIGRYNIAIPYTKEEQLILQQAFKAVGSEWHDLNNGNYHSEEVKSTNKQSPIAKPKKNRFGV